MMMTGCAAATSPGDVGDGDWDVSSAHRFLIAVEPAELLQPHVVFNWFEELKRLVPTHP